MRTELPLREITIEEIYKDVQKLRTDLLTHNHLTFGSQGLTGTVSGILQSPNFLSGSSGWQIKPDGSIEANSGTFRGIIQATSGYFGDVTNGITIAANGLVIVGTGYVRTGTSGARIEMVKTVTGAGGYTDGLLNYDSNGDVVFRLINGGWPALTIFERGGVAGGAQITGTTAGNTFTLFKVKAIGLEDAVTIESDGGTARSDYAALRINVNSTFGYGLRIVNDNDAYGTLIRLATHSKKAKNLIEIDETSWTAVHSARITNENYLQFPAYYHCSDFDENTGESSIDLTSSVIAKAYWIGGGTSGTQKLWYDANGNHTEIRLSTTDTTSRSSSLTFCNPVAASERCIEFRVRMWRKTNTYMHIGFYDGSTNYAWFSFDTAIDANNIYAECYAGSLTRVDTGKDMTDYWRTFRIIQYPGPYTYFFMDDQLVATITTNTSTSAMKPYAIIGNTADEEKKLFIDYIKIWSGRVDTAYHE